MAMTSAGYDGTVDEVQWATLITSAGASQYGVLGAADWKVSAHPTIDKAVNVAPGAGWGHGVYDASTATEPVQCEPIASGSRWDLITARRDWQPPGGATVFAAVTGGPAKDLPTRLNSPGVQDEQPLALVKWTAGQTQPQEIVDLRCWAGNGGIFAGNDLVRKYLTRVGAVVNIAGKIWSCRLNGNEDPEWVKTSEFGKVPLFAVHGTLSGGTPPADAQFLEISGSVVQETDPAGYGRITFPSPFPNGLVSVHFTDGDEYAHPGPVIFGAAGRPDVFGSAGYGNKTEIVYSMRSIIPVNNAYPRLPNTRHRVNYTAKGW